MIGFFWWSLAFPCPHRHAIQRDWRNKTAVHPPSRFSITARTRAIGLARPDVVSRSWTSPLPLVCYVLRRHLFHWRVPCEGVQARASLQFPPASGRGRWATVASGCSHGCVVDASDAVGVTQGAPLTGSQSELSCAGASVFALSVALQATGPTPEVCSVGLLEAVAPGGPVRLDRVRVVCLLALRGGPRCALSRSTAGRESHFRAAGVLECRLASGPASIGPEAYASTLFESLRVD